MEERKRIKSRHFIIAGTFLILFGISYLVYDWYNDYKMLKDDNKQLEAFFDNNYDNKKNLINEDYIMVLEIPKINLKRGIYDIKSSKNDVNLNIEIINSSDMPNVNNSNLILASHSGTSSISYFKNLDKLELGDYSYIYYENKKYVYKVVNIYEVKKNGAIEIIRDNNKNTLTMITCDKDNYDKQIVYISELI